MSLGERLTRAEVCEGLDVPIQVQRARGAVGEVRFPGQLGAADGQTADGVAVEADLLQLFRRLAAQVLERRALLDAEQGLGLALAEAPA